MVRVPTGAVPRPDYPIPGLLRKEETIGLQPVLHKRSAGRASGQSSLVPGRVQDCRL